MWQDDFFNKAHQAESKDEQADERAQAQAADAREARLVPDRPDPNVRLIDPSLLSDELDAAPVPPQIPPSPAAQMLHDEPTVVEFADDELARKAQEALAAIQAQRQAEQAAQAEPAEQVQHQEPIHEAQATAPTPSQVAEPREVAQQPSTPSSAHGSANADTAAASANADETQPTAESEQTVVKTQQEPAVLSDTQVHQMHEELEAIEDQDDRIHEDVLLTPSGPALDDPRQAFAAMREESPTEHETQNADKPVLPEIVFDEDESISQLAAQAPANQPPSHATGDEQPRTYPYPTDVNQPQDAAPPVAEQPVEPEPAADPQPAPGPSFHSISELAHFKAQQEGQVDDEEWDIPEIDISFPAAPVAADIETASADDLYAKPSNDNEYGFDTESLGDTNSEYAISASRAVLNDSSGRSMLSLITRTQEDLDELDPVFGAFQDVQTGQYGFMHQVIRPYPEFRNDAKRYISVLKTGVDPGADADKSAWDKAWEYVKWGLRHLWYEGNKNSKNLGPSAPPAKPWAKNGDVKPLSSALMDSETKKTITDAEKKAESQAHYEVRLYLGAVGKAEDKADLDRMRTEAEIGFVGYNTSYQSISFEPANGWDAAIGFMPPEHETQFCLSAEELGELIRMPDDTTNPPGIDVRRAPFKPLLPRRPLPTVNDPLNPDHGMIPIGTLRPGTKDVKTVALPNFDLDHHLVLFGRTGSGKSELIKRLVFGTAKAGMPIVAVDPHGTLNDDLLHMLVAFCPERREDIVMLDIGDEDWPVAINPLDIRYRHQLEPTVEAVMAMISRTLQFDARSATRAANYIRVALLALGEANLAIQDPDAKCTLMQVPTFFLNQQFRHLIMDFCTNATAREQFDPENGAFEGLGEGMRSEHLVSVLRPFQTLGSRQSFANVFSSGQNKLDFPKLMSGRKIVLLKMARFSHQKALGELVGALVVPWIVSSMESWARRKDPETGEYIGIGMRLFIDECHTVMSNSAKDIENMLAETRKYDVGGVFGTQFPRQLGETREAFYANTGSKITFVLDPAGVAGFDKSLDAGSRLIDAQDIVALPKYVGYCNLLVDRGNTGPFSIAFLRPLDEGFDRRDPDHIIAVQRVIDQSRGMVCNNKARVEEAALVKTETIIQALNALVQEKDANMNDDLRLDGNVSDEWHGFSG